LWLFSSGPVGPDPVDAKGRDQKEASVPQGIPELASSMRAREHRVFFGAYDPSLPPAGMAERFMSLMPATIRDAVPAGDYRDWPEIEGWARDIARHLRGEVQGPATGAA
jgi:menaquinone-dependent protoporphyrinogen oxidase